MSRAWIKRIRLEEMIRVMVMQMTDFMVPYEAVRRRLLETRIISEKEGTILLEEENQNIDVMVRAYLEDLNTTLDKASMKKTISGLRDLLLQVEENKKVSN